MTKLNLIETSLLAASGELDGAAQQRLDAYFTRHSEARAQYDSLKGELDLLRSLPMPALSAGQKQQYASNIKAGIQKKLRQTKREENAAKRSRFIYGALAGISAAAAAFIIVAGVWSLNQSSPKTGPKPSNVAIAPDGKIMDAKESLETANSYDDDINNVQQSIDKLQSDGTSVAGLHDTDMSNLLDALSTVPSDTDNIPDTGAM